MKRGLCARHDALKIEQVPWVLPACNYRGAVVGVLLSPHSFFSRSLKHFELSTLFFAIGSLTFSLVPPQPVHCTSRNFVVSGVSQIYFTFDRFSDSQYCSGHFQDPTIISYLRLPYQICARKSISLMRNPLHLFQYKGQLRTISVAVP